MLQGLNSAELNGEVVQLISPAVGVDGQPRWVVEVKGAAASRRIKARPGNLDYLLDDGAL